MERTAFDKLQLLALVGVSKGGVRVARVVKLNERMTDTHIQNPESYQRRNRGNA